MQLTELFEVFDAENFVFVVAGLTVLAVAVLPRLLHDTSFSESITLVALGWVVFSLPLGLDTPDPIVDHDITEHLTELGVIVSLMAAGLALDRPPGWRAWASTWRLLGITMPLTIGAVALLGWWAGLVPAAAVLLGAALAPTDPVLGKEVHVGAPGEVGESEEGEIEEGEIDDHDPGDKGEEDEVRFALTSEAGLNDGLAFPFTNMAIVMALAGARPGNWIGSWLAVDVLYQITVGLVLGLLLGWALARVLLWMPAEGDISEAVTAMGALGATLIVYGLTEYAGGYGFIATFVAAATIRATDRWNPRHRALQSFVESCERLVMAAVLLLFGGAIAGGLLTPLRWSHVLVALTAVLVVRPLAGAAGLIGMSPLPWRDRTAISFYGIRGIATFYYLSYALGEAEFPGREELWATAGLVVLLSLIAHSLTAGRVLEGLDRSRRKRDRRPLG